MGATTASQKPAAALLAMALKGSPRSQLIAAGVLMVAFVGSFHLRLTDQQSDPEG